MVKFVPQWDYLDEDEINRMLGYIDTGKVEFEQDFWREYHKAFKGHDPYILGKELKRYYEYEHGDLEKRPKK
jgi:hypothetical protein